MRLRKFFSISSNQKEKLFFWSRATVVVVAVVAVAVVVF